jgi:hypothetical protein
MWKSGFIVFVSFAAAASAELVWRQKSMPLKMHPVQVEAQARFNCTNTGAEPVDILSVQTSCGCLKAVATANRIMPGAAGSVAVTFDARDKTGPQRKSIAVRSSDNSKRPVLLYIEANIPTVYTIEPERIEWQMEGGRESKTCRLVNHLDEATPV